MISIICKMSSIRYQFIDKNRDYLLNIKIYDPKIFDIINLSQINSWRSIIFYISVFMRIFHPQILFTIFFEVVFLYP